LISGLALGRLGLARGLFGVGTSLRAGTRYLLNLEL